MASSSSTRNPLSRVDHRPWPPPARPWSVEMTWRDLLFAHWPVDGSALRDAVPRALEVDRFEGRAWLGVVPFRMTGVRHRLLPPIPGAVRFPELNVRTYATVGGKPGVYFFSLDAASRIAVSTARATFGLPYFNARMRCEREGDRVVYRSERTHRGAPPATLRCAYGPAGGDAPTDLDRWLTERYCLYTADPHGRVFRAEVHHEPWPLRPAWWEAETCDMTRLLGVDLPSASPRLAFADRLDVVAWRPERVR